MGARYSVTGTKVVDQGAQGGIKWALEYRGKALGLFDPRERNAILAEGFRKMGLAWIAKWLPLRFTNYAYKLGYDVSEKYSRLKARIMENPLPLIGPPGIARRRKIGRAGKLAGTTYTYGTAGPADKLVNTSTGASSRSTSPGGKPRVTIKIPTGHAVAAIVSATLRSLPAHEVKDLAKVLDTSLVGMLNGSDTTDTERSRLTGIQRDSLNIGRKTAGSRAKSSRSKAG